MKHQVVDTNKAKVGDIELDDSVFRAKVRDHLFWEVVRMQLANRRSGTHSTKTVTEVQGSKKKPYKQKGTGQARHGTKRAMNMRGGGVVFGPRPRDYSYRMPKKMVRVALRSALSLRLSQDALLIVRGWAPAKPRTKEAQKTLTALNCEKTLVIGTRDNTALALSVRNLPLAKFLPVEGINVYDILKYDRLVLDESVIPELTTRLKSAPSRTEQARAESEVR